jgi:hypothetical protein
VVKERGAWSVRILRKRIGDRAGGKVSYFVNLAKFKITTSGWVVKRAEYGYMGAAFYFYYYYYLRQSS